MVSSLNLRELVTICVVWKGRLRVKSASKPRGDPQATFIRHTGRGDATKGVVIQAQER